MTPVKHMWKGLIVTQLFLIVSGCSKREESSQIPGPAKPILTAKSTYQVGEPIILGLKWPHTKWRLTPGQEEQIDADESWPFYVKINGTEFKIRTGLTPFSGLSFPKWTLSDDLYEDYRWQPGEYHVVYVLKGVRITHPDVPESERVLEEWLSNDVTFRIVD